MHSSFARDNGYRVMSICISYIEEVGILSMKHNDKHEKGSLPSARKIRRGCNKELYRTIKRLHVYIPEDLVQQGEDLYYKKVIQNLIWIAENQSNRKVLADWWEEAVAGELAQLWNVEENKLVLSFRQAFGG